MQAFYKYNLYRSSFYTWKFIAIILIVAAVLVAMFTLLSYQSPPIITSDTIIQEANCQTALNTPTFVNSQFDLFNDLISNNLICFLCLEHTEIYEKPYGIQALLTGKMTPNQQFIPPPPGYLVYSIGSINKPQSQSCWFNALQATSIERFPTLISDDQGRITEQTEASLELTWGCSYNTQIWVCKSSSVLFQSMDSYRELFGMFKMLGTQLQYYQMRFAVIKYENQYFLYNEVMLLIWIGFVCIIGVITAVIVEEFPCQSKLVFLQIFPLRYLILSALILNNHPMFIIQLFTDNMYLRMMNLVLQCLAQGYFLFYSIDGLWNIYLCNKQHKYLRIANITASAVFSTLQSMILVREVLDMLDELPTETFFIQGRELSYFGIYSMLVLAYIIGGSMLLTFHLSSLKARAIHLSQNDEELRIVMSFYRGLQTYLVVMNTFICGFFARIIWQHFFIYDINILYYDHYQISLVNLFFLVMVWFFDQINPEEINVPLYEVQEEECKIEEIEMHVMHQQDEDEQIQPQEAEEHVHSHRRLDTVGRFKSYNDMEQPETELRDLHLHKLEEAKQNE